MLNLKLLCLGLALMLVAVLARAQMPAEATTRRVALVIGNAGYADAPLKNPVNDARAMATTLRELGFDVIARENADLAAMESAVREFGRRLERAHVGLFYFAGHGMQIKGRNFLIPVGARFEHEDEVAYRSLDAGQVLDKMDSAKTQVNLLMLDACRNNPFHRQFRARRQGLAEMEAPAGTLIAFATAPGSVAMDGEGTHGVYTQHLLKQMRQRGLPVEQVFKRVRIGVAEETQERQIPWESSSLREDFQFLPAASAPAADAIDLEFWNSIKDSPRRADFAAYLEQFPRGRFAALARIRLAEAPAPARPAGPAATPLPAPPPVPVVPVVPVVPAVPVAPAVIPAPAAATYTALGISDDGRWQALLGSDGRLQLFEAGAARRTYVPPFAGSALRLSGDGQRLAVAGPAGELALYERDGRLAWNVGGSDAALRHLVFSLDGRYLLAGTGAGRLSLRRLGDGATVAELAAGGPLRDLQLSPDSRFVAVVSGDETAPRVRVIELGSGREVFTAAASAALFSVNGRYLLVAAGGDVPTLYDLASGRELRRFARYPQRILAGAYAEAGDRVATLDAGGRVQLLDTADGRPRAVLALGRVPRAIAFATDARAFAIIDSQGQFALHRLQETP